jgi:mercuric ion transport protein
MMREELLAGGGLIAALGASTCCVLPVSLSAVGLSGAWLSSLTALAPYQIFLRIAAILLLATGFWLVYASRPALAEGAACAVAPRRLTKTALWVGAIVMALVLSSGWWYRFIS